jgi:DNA-binding NarL/FixJ family response regulator
VPGDGLEIGRASPSIAARAAAATRGFPGGALVSPEPVRVLVLYSHPLMGEGLERMLAAEQDVIVDAVDIADAGAVDAAIAREPAVIVVEEGGAVDAADVVRRSNCPVVLDVDITTTRAWTLRRETLSSRPDEFLAAIRNAVSGASGPEREPEADRRPETERGLQPLVVPS